IRELGKAGKAHIFQGKVTEVDAEGLTLNVELDEGFIVKEVRIRALVTDDTKGIWAVPAVNSHVTIGLLEGGTDYVTLNVSEIESFVIKIGNMSMEITAEGATLALGSITLEMTDEGFVFNGGANLGMVKVTELVEKLNAVENKCNSIINSFNTHIHVAPGGSTGGPTVPMSGLLTPTTVNDIKNDQMKH